MIIKDNIQDAHNIATDFIKGNALEEFEYEEDTEEFNFSYRLGVLEGSNFMLSFLYDIEEAEDESALELIDIRLSIYRKHMAYVLTMMNEPKSYSYFEGMIFSITLISDLVQM